MKQHELVDKNIIVNKVVEIIQVNKSAPLDKISYLGGILRYFEAVEVELPQAVQIDIMDRLALSKFDDILDKNFIMIVRNLKVLPVINESINIWGRLFSEIQRRISYMNLHSVSHLLTALAQNPFHVKDTLGLRKLEKMDIEAKIKDGMEAPQFTKHTASILYSLSTLQCVKLKTLVKICRTINVDKIDDKSCFLVFMSIARLRLRSLDKTGEINEIEDLCLDRILEDQSDLSLRINILWHMCLDPKSMKHSNFEKFLKQTFQKVDMTHINYRDLTQLYSILVVLKIVFPDLFNKFKKEFVANIVDARTKIRDTLPNSEVHGYVNDFSKDSINAIVPHLQSKGYTIVEEYDNGIQKIDLYIKELNL